MKEISDVWHLHRAAQNDKLVIIYEINFLIIKKVDLPVNNIVNEK